MTAASLYREAPIRDPAQLTRLLGPEVSLDSLLDAASRLRDEVKGHRLTYSKKLFIPLTQLCRDRCGYCTFARPPRPGTRVYMSLDEMVAVAGAGLAMGCHEVLFTLGDQPERRYTAARAQLAEMGYSSTVEYLIAACKAVVEATGLLPHVNPGVLTLDQLSELRRVSVSGGLMLEQLSSRLLERGQAHWASPDKVASRRIGTIEQAGKVDFPFTTGMLVGIGETLAERAATLIQLADLASQEHVQEVIIQNFRAKPDTSMAQAPEPDQAQVLRTVAVARLALGGEVNLQAPPNLAPDGYGDLIAAGINDWGGVSPLTSDYVNPESPWPQLETLDRICSERGFQLVERLAVYPEYIRTWDAAQRWLDPGMLPVCWALADSQGYARQDGWFAGSSVPVPAVSRPRHPAGRPRAEIHGSLRRAELGERLEETEIASLFEARGSEVDHLCHLADDVRRRVNGDVVTYVVNRNINYTNICYFRCGFCGFSKGKMSENLRGKPYLMGLDEIVDRCREAADRGATEVCLQGGIHPDFTGDFYLDVCRSIKQALPRLHVHAFSPLEVWQGAKTSGRTLEQMLSELAQAGLGTLPGTAAEILDDRIRRIICPDKLNTDQWVEVITTAHRLGLRTTSTIMFGHVEGPQNWARHLVVLRDLQELTGGITEFVPLPFVHMEAPIYRKGRSRKGPTWEEVLKMHAIARLALTGLIDNIQCSWVKLGVDGCLELLQSGCNDMGGTLMNESISRAAGASHGQEVTASEMGGAIRSIGRLPQQRDTLYRSLTSLKAATA